MISAKEVADQARGHCQAGTNFGVGYCLRFSRMCAGAPAGTYDAITAWRAAKYRHTGTPPRGAFVFWSGGAAGHGHVAVSDGNGYCYSTDILRAGRVDRVTITYITARWGLRLLGWSEDVNGVRATGLTPALRAVHLDLLRPGLRNNDVLIFQRALREQGWAAFTPTGYYGALTIAAVRKFQTVQGWSGADADGVPGPKTCGLLGLTVV